MTGYARPPVHPDFSMLEDSWDVALEADGYAAATRRGYRKGLASLASWLEENSSPETGPCEVTRDDIRGWLVSLRRERSQNTARTYYAAIRSFFRFLLDEGEIQGDPCEGIRSPSPSEPETPVVSPEDLKRLLATCRGNDFINRRDKAVILLFVDGGVTARGACRADG